MVDKNIPDKQSSLDFSSNRLCDADQALLVLQNRWQIVTHIGQGGMGTVYKARDLRLANRQCVVKKLRDDFFHEEDKEKALSLFQREAAVLSRLQHSNIVHIFDCFQENGNNYLVMEYVEGKNLYEMSCERGQAFPEKQVLDWTLQICEVLSYLHANDPPVIYRDLKPSNIMIDGKGRVKLVDFGIARHYHENSENTHVVSAGYSPPEQYWGAADPRSDIYALGATMYFLLTGQEPRALQTCSPKKLNPLVSDFANRIVERAMAQDTQFRYQSALEMRQDVMQRFEQEQKLIGSPKWMLLLMYVVAIFLACVGFLTLLNLTDVHNDISKSFLNGKSGNQVNDLSVNKRDNLWEEESQTKVNEVNERKIGAMETDANQAFEENEEEQLTDPEGLAPTPGK